MKKWYSVEMDTKAYASVIRYFREYLKMKKYRHDSGACYNNTIIRVETDEEGLCELNNVLDDFFATQGAY